MSLVPLTTAAPAPARAALTLPRASAPSSRPAAPGAPSPAASRAQAVVRSEARGAAPAAKAGEHFASVLAAVQEDAGSSAATAESRHTAVEVRDTPVERDHGESTAPDAPPHVTPDDPRQPAVMSSWLLLALENAPIARSQGDTATLETVEGTPVASAIDGVGVGTDAAAVVPPLAGAVTPDVVGAATLTAQPIAAGNPSAFAEAVATAPPPSASASAGSPTLTVPGPEPQVGTPASAERAPDSPRPAQRAAAERDAADDPATFDGVQPEAVARWRAATQATGRAVDVPEADRALEVRPVEGRAETATPGTAASRLAQLVGRSADTGEDGALTPPVVGIDGPGAPPAPTARATELLQRLVQSAGDTGSRMRQDTGAGNAAAFAPPFATAPAPPAASAAVVEAAAPIASLPPAVGEQVTRQIVSSVKMQWKEGIGEARLHLRPEGLGSVTVALRVEHGAVTAVVRADSAQVQDWVLQHQQTLRQQMEAAGLHLDELTVDPDDRGQQKRHQDAEPERRRRQSRSTDAGPDTARFELLA